MAVRDTLDTILLLIDRIEDMISRKTKASFSAPRDSSRLAAILPFNS